MYDTARNKALSALTSKPVKINRLKHFIIIIIIIIIHHCSSLIFPMREINVKSTLCTYVVDTLT